MLCGCVKDDKNDNKKADTLYCDTKHCDGGTKDHNGKSPKVYNKARNICECTGCRTNQCYGNPKGGGPDPDTGNCNLMSDDECNKFHKGRGQCSGTTDGYCLPRRVDGQVHDLKCVSDNYGHFHCVLDK